MLPHRKRTRMARLAKGSESNGPGLLFMLVALVAVAVAGARLLGFGPGLGPRTEPTSSPVTVGVTTVPPPESTDEVPVAASRPVATVLVYHAHATENYGTEMTHTTGGQPGHVVDVGRAFAAALRSLDVRAVHDTEVHDHPTWAEAFPNAALTVNALMREQEEVSALFDIHRDAIARDVGKEVTTTTINGQPTARVLLVVGDQNNPYADSNAEFAETLKAKMDEMYPGLSRGIRIQRDDYNGRLHPNSLQVFIGDNRYNTLEEAETAARLFAEVVAALFQ